MKESTPARVIVSVVVLHSVISGLHGLIHQALVIRLSLAQLNYVLWVTIVAPVVGVVLFWRSFRTPGAILTLASMIGALVFGIYYHVWATGPDNILTLPQNGALPSLFQGTAVVLLILEALGCYVALRYFVGIITSARPALGKAEPALKATWKKRQEHRLGKLQVSRQDPDRDRTRL